MLKIASVLAIAAVSATAFAATAEAGEWRYGYGYQPTTQSNSATNVVNQGQFGGGYYCGTCGSSGSQSGVINNTQVNQALGQANQSNSATNVIDQVQSGGGSQSGVINNTQVNTSGN
jgi:hypothetical protein